MLDNTKQAIKQLIKEADAIKNNAFGTSVLPTVETLESTDQVVQQDDKDVILKVDLGNGQVGRLSKKELQKTGK